MFWFFDSQCTSGSYCERIFKFLHLNILFSDHVSVELMGRSVVTAILTCSGQFSSNFVPPGPCARVQSWSVFTSVVYRSATVLCVDVDSFIFFDDGVCFSDKPVICDRFCKVIIYHFCKSFIVYVYLYHAVFVYSCCHYDSTGKLVWKPVHFMTTWYRKAVPNAQAYYQLVVMLS